MDKKTFLENFGVIANAPNGIQQLREIILSLAVEGHLVDDQEGGASAEGWTSTTLGDVTRIRTGKLDANASSDSGAYPFFTCAKNPLKIDSYSYDTECVLLAGNGNFDVNYFSGKFDAYQRTYIIEALDVEQLFVPYLYIYMQRHSKVLLKQAIGGVIRYIKIGFLTGAPIMLPPLSEQKRIVAKVDQLLALCDQLEAEKAKLETLRTAARASAIDAISTATTPEELSTAWSRISSNWDSMIDSTESVDSLRSLILELAIKGQLVEQINEDGTASDLLEQIQVRRNVMSKPKNISKTNQGNSFLQINPELPKNWIWTKLAEIGSINPRNSADDQVQAGFIPMAQISERFSRPHTFDIRPWSEIKTGYTHVQNGDVVVAKITPCFENGKATVIEGLPNSIGAGTTEIHVVRPILVKPEYILLFLNSPFFVVNGIPKMTGTAGQKRLPSEYFSNFPFPLPPLGEQERIIEKVNNLMHLCEEIEACLRLRTEIESAFSSASSQLLTV